MLLLLLLLLVLLLPLRRTIVLLLLGLLLLPLPLFFNLPSLLLLVRAVGVLMVAALATAVVVGQRCLFCAFVLGLETWVSDGVASQGLVPLFRKNVKLRGGGG